MTRKRLGKVIGFRYTKLDPLKELNKIIKKRYMKKTRKGDLEAQQVYNLKDLTRRLKEHRERIKGEIYKNKIKNPFKELKLKVVKLT